MNKSLLKIRKANENDINILNNLMCQSKLYWNYDKIFIDKFMAYFSLKNNYVSQGRTFVAELNGDIFGFYSFIINNKSNLELDYFFLSPNWRGKDMRKKLWEKCVETAFQLKKVNFIICSDPSAEKFYLKMGCKKIGEYSPALFPNKSTPIGIVLQKRVC
jgi:streptomycin 6-kinase